VSVYDVLMQALRRLLALIAEVEKQGGRNPALALAKLDPT
jgi:hypothetical protein